MSSATGDTNRKEGFAWNDVIKPLAVRSYNLFMGGVDRVDQQLHGIRALRKTYKWYKTLAVRLIMQAALNAHKVFQYTTGKVEVDFLKYLHDVIALLVTITPQMIHDIPLDGTVQWLTGRHFPEQKKPNAGDSGKRPAKMCCVCYARGIRTVKDGKVKTVYICPSSWRTRTPSR